MAHLVGAAITIPGEAWNPPQNHPTVATVLHFARATRGYPEGRVRILCENGTDWWWDVTKLPAEWVSTPADPATVNVLGATPARSRRRSTATAATPGTATRRRRGRTSRAAADGYDSSGAGMLSDTEGPTAIVDVVPPQGSFQEMTPVGPSPTVTAEGVAPGADPSPAPLRQAPPPPAPLDLAGSGTELPSDDAAAEPSAIGGVRPRRSTRQRKSLRFAPGTVSPGARAPAAAISAIHSSPETRTPGAAHGAGATAAVTSPVYLLSPLASPLASPRPSDGGAGGRSFYAIAASAAQKPGYASAPPALTPVQRLRNTALIVLVMLPALFFYRQLRHGCSAGQRLATLGGSGGSGLAGLVGLLDGGLGQLLSGDFWCAVGFQRPLLAVNLVFFFNVDVLFWYIGLLQGSTWLIDPFWTLAPVLIGLFYQYHPAAVMQPLRSRLAMGLLWVWAVRLTHSYFRREDWQVGAREDWRYARMAQRLGRLRWAAVSFFTVGVTQHLMLVGITLPLLAIHTSTAAWNPLVDVPIFLAAATGIMIALIADNQLREFMLENEKRDREGRPRLLLLDTGLWRYSRHPNFFGEQLWWWSLAMWAVVCGQPWMVVGTAFNSVCFIPITRMNEERMLERPERAELYRYYQKTTSVWVPWFRQAVTA